MAPVNLVDRHDDCPVRLANATARNMIDGGDDDDVQEESQLLSSVEVEEIKTAGKSRFLQLNNGLADKSPEQMKNMHTR